MKFSLLAKRMLLVIAISSLLFAAGGLVFYRSWEALPFAVGVFLMAALNALRVIMLERTVQKALKQTDANAAKNQVQLQYLVRFLLTGAVLCAAAMLPFINLWGAVLGIFSMPIASYSAKFIKPDEEGD